HLDDIVDLAEEATDKLELYRIKQVTAPARAAGECLAAAGQEIERALEQLEGFQGLDERRAVVNRLEEEVDRITRDALGELFSDNGLSAAELIKWKDLYDLLENTMDACDQVANILQTVSIKNA